MEEGRRKKEGNTGRREMDGGILNEEMDDEGEGDGRRQDTSKIKQMKYYTFRVSLILG